MKCLIVCRKNNKSIPVSEAKKTCMVKKNCSNYKNCAKALFIKDEGEAK